VRLTAKIVLTKELGVVAESRIGVGTNGDEKIDEKYNKPQDETVVCSTMRIASECCLFGDNNSPHRSPAMQQKIKAQQHGSFVNGTIDTIPYFNISKYVGAVKVFVLLNFMISRTLFTAAQVHCPLRQGTCLVP
jgi:hypothetical protein